MATCIREAECRTIAASRLRCIGSFWRFQIEPFMAEEFPNRGVPRSV